MNRLSNGRQTNAHTVSSITLGVLTQRKDFWTSLVIGITMLSRFLSLATSFIVKECSKNLLGLFKINFDISPIAIIAFYCNIEFALMYGILADLVTVFLVVYQVKIQYFNRAVTYCSYSNRTFSKNIIKVRSAIL